MIMPPCQLPDCSKDFRASLKKRSPNLPVDDQKVKKRLVPAFTIQAFQKNTKVIPPPKCNVYDGLPLKPTAFRTAYLKHEIPAYIEFSTQGQGRLAWQLPVEQLDYHYYLPLFLSGLSEGRYPFNFIVESGIRELVEKGSHKVLPCVPEIITPLKEAYATKRPAVMCYANKCIQSLVTGCPNVGEALVPYYKQILPKMSLFLAKHRRTDLDEVIILEDDLAYSIENTLNDLERTGGPGAFINIKYFVPTYESCLRN